MKMADVAAGEKIKVMVYLLAVELERFMFEGDDFVHMSPSVRLEWLLDSVMESGCMRFYKDGDFWSVISEDGQCLSPTKYHGFTLREYAEKFAKGFQNHKVRVVYISNHFVVPRKFNYDDNIEIEKMMGPEHYPVNLTEEDPSIPSFEETQKEVRAQEIQEKMKHLGLRVLKGGTDEDGIPHDD